MIYVFKSFKRLCWYPLASLWAYFGMEIWNGVGKGLEEWMAECWEIKSQWRRGSGAETPQHATHFPTSPSGKEEGGGLSQLLSQICQTDWAYFPYTSLRIFQYCFFYICIPANPLLFALSFVLTCFGSFFQNKKTVYLFSRSFKFQSILWLFLRKLTWERHKIDVAC